MRRFGALAAISLALIVPAAVALLPHIARKAMTAKWIKCTLMEGGKTIRVNMALAATFVPHGAGTGIWIPGDQIGIDVVEMPEQIDAAIADSLVEASQT